jgi:diguanylate cyclase (GGDEF)-like protein/PAS domain S-box-containing protein
MSKIKNYDEKSLHLNLLHKALSLNTEGVIITDIDRKIKWSNNAFEIITGYKFEDIVDEKISLLESGEHSDEFIERVYSFLNKFGVWKGEIINKDKDGNILPVDVKISYVNEDGLEGYVCIYRDLSHEKISDRRIRELRDKDSLTGLINRTYFTDYINMFLKENPKSDLSFVLIDIKGFKNINDSLGHDIGDILLKKISNRILEIIGEDILSRFDGDEFVICMKDVSDKKYVLNRCKNIMDTITKTYEIEGKEIHLGVNMGISRYPLDGKDVTELIRLADIAMYKANDNPDMNIAFYDYKMSMEIEERFLMTNMLMDAIDKDEFELIYQPMFCNVNEGEIVGAEALLRWNNGEFGSVSPERFIPITENTGMIVSIGNWIIGKVCSDIRTWIDKNLNVRPISINLSIKQLEQKDFYLRVMDILEKHNIIPELIEFEITESVTSGEKDIISENLKELSKNGHKISMDDFGTGYSSFGKLTTFNLDKLKIDKIFIENLVEDKKMQKLVNSIVAMAKSLELTVVAEGIETYKKFEYMKEIGCDISQGYFFSIPISKIKYEELIKI